MQNMPILELGAAALCLFSYVTCAPFLRKFGAKIDQPVSSGASDSIWTTRTGDVFEEVGTFFVRADVVTFRHKHGTARLAIPELTDLTRTQLIRRYQENHSLALLPRENDIRQVSDFSIEAA